MCRGRGTKQENGKNGGICRGAIYYIVVSKFSCIFPRPDIESLLYQAKYGIDLALGGIDSIHFVWNKPLALFNEKQRVQKRDETCVWNEQRKSKANHCCLRKRPQKGAKDRVINEMAA